MLKIAIKTVPHRTQRYDTIGDYWKDVDGKTHVSISDLGNWKLEFLVAIHELIELALCRDRDITDKQIDVFDMTWEPHHDIGEPGDDMLAPYWAEHQIATGFERLLAAQLGINWLEYERIVSNLSYGEKDHVQRGADREGDPGEGAQRSAPDTGAD